MDTWASVYSYCESSNLIYVVICQGCKEEFIGETVCLVKERINIYIQHISHSHNNQQLTVEENLRTCIFSFYKF